MTIKAFIHHSIVLLALFSGAELLARSPTEFLLGPTGLRGIHNKSGIQVTQVAPGSPADGKINQNAIIVGAGAKHFKGDPRAALALAIDSAETTQGKGELFLLLDDGSEVALQLEVLGEYSNTAPYNCPKSDLIVKQAADYLAAEIEWSLSPENKRSRGYYESGATHSALLGLMATGEKRYIDLVARAIKASDMVNPDPEVLAGQVTGEKPSGLVAWYWGYNCILLGEYFLPLKLMQ